ncbi:MAG: peptidylprolyl isomerase [Solirubrobacterales bacterium]|nr:peptidylprolyl isomerase [Solirubrobacterales bacterium]
MRSLRPQLPLALLAILAAFALGLAACGDDEEPSETTAASEPGCAEVDAPAPKDDSFKRPERVLEPGQPATATVETSCGSFTIALDTKRSPNTANSFAFLAEQGFYDDTVFHRIAPGFVIQGGDPKGSDPQLAGSGGPGYSITEAPPQSTTYRRGLVAMAKTEVEPPGTSGSQFFVVTAPADAGLPPDYAVLGKVSEGMDVVAAIGELGDPATEQPTQAVTIDQVTVDDA